jgi:hypothetical protein
MSDALMDTGLAPDLTLTSHVEQLARLRQVEAHLTSELRGVVDAFEATIADRRANIAGIRRSIEAVESDVRGLALLAYERTQSKAPAPGVSVVVGKEYDIDEAAGLVWAKATGMCLIPAKLDTKAAQKMAAVTEVPFVTVIEKASVRIATDLTKALTPTGSAA